MTFSLDKVILKCRQNIFCENMMNANVKMLTKSPFVPFFTVHETTNKTNNKERAVTRFKK